MCLQGLHHQAGWPAESPANISHHWARLRQERLQFWKRTETSRPAVFSQGTGCQEQFVRNSSPPCWTKDCNNLLPSLPNPRPFQHLVRRFNWWKKNVWTTRKSCLELWKNRRGPMELERVCAQWYHDHKYPVWLCWTFRLRFLCLRGLADFRHHPFTEFHMGIEKNCRKWSSSTHMRYRSADIMPTERARDTGVLHKTMDRGPSWYRGFFLSHRLALTSVTQTRIPHSYNINHWSSVQRFIWSTRSYRSRWCLCRKCGRIINLPLISSMPTYPVLWFKAIHANTSQYLYIEWNSTASRKSKCMSLWCSVYLQRPSKRFKWTCPQELHRSELAVSAQRAFNCGVSFRDRIQLEVVSTNEKKKCWD